MRKKFISRVLTALMATALVVTGLPAGIYDKAYAEEDMVVIASEEAEAEEETEEAETIDASEVLNVFSLSSEVSEFGHRSTTLYDADGNSYVGDKDFDSDGIVYGTLPAALDLRTYNGKNIVTGQIENQNGTGTCWAHGTIAAAESNLIKNGYVDGKTVNFSEAQLVWFLEGAYSEDTSDFLYKDYIPYDEYGSLAGTKCFDMGGNIWYSTAGLSRGTGTIDESRMKDLSEMASKADYEDLSKYESLRYESDYMLQNSNWYVLNPSSASTQRDAIKQSLIDTGAMDMAYGALTNDEVPNVENTVTYNGVSTIAYYNYKATDPTDEDYGTNHEICLIGWDDNFPKENFGSTPAGDGAWLCRNSWGADYGASGYFWISYYDKSLDDANTVEMVPRNTYGDTIYQYGGAFANGINLKSEGVSIAAVNYYTASNDDTLTAVGAYFYDADVPYTISIYTDAKTGSMDGGTLAATIEGTSKVPGFHIYDLPKEVTVAKGKTFSVVVEYKKDKATVFVDNHQYTSTSTQFYAVTSSKTQLITGAEFDSLTKVYTKGVPSSVKATPAPGTYNEKISVKLSSDVDGASIYYTTDGTEPSKASTLVTDKTAIEFDIPEKEGDSKSYTLKAIAYADSIETPAVKTFTYTMVNGTVEDPEPEPEPENDKNKVTFVFDAAGGTVIGSETLTFDLTKDTVYTGFPKAHKPGMDHVKWVTDKGYEIKEDDKVRSYYYGKITLTAKYDTMTLAVGQKVDVSDYFAAYIQSGQKYKVKFSGKKASSKFSGGSVIVTAKKKGVTTGTLYVKSGKKWKAVQGAPTLQIENVKLGGVWHFMSSGWKDIKLTESYGVRNIEELSIYENDMSFEIKNPKGKSVLEWYDMSEWSVYLNKSGTATIKTTLSRDGYTSTIKTKFKVNK